MTPLPPDSAIAASCRALTIALAVFLFVASSFPAAGLAFPGITHRVAHLTAYAVIGFAYGLGWQRQPSLPIFGFVAALSAIQECSEIFTHHHALDVADVLVDSIGAAIGGALTRPLVPATARV